MMNPLVLQEKNSKVESQNEFQQTQQQNESTQTNNTLNQPTRSRFYEKCTGKEDYDFSQQQYVASWIILGIASAIMFVSLINMIYQQFKYQSHDYYFNDMNEHSQTFKGTQDNRISQNIYNTSQSASFYNSMLNHSNTILNAQHLHQQNLRSNVTQVLDSADNSQILYQGQTIYQGHTPVGIQNQSGVFVSTGANSFIHYQQQQYSRQQNQNNLEGQNHYNSQVQHNDRSGRVSNQASNQRKYSYPYQASME
eukprot:403350915